MIDIFAEPRHGAALQIPHYQYRRFNRITRYEIICSYEVLLFFGGISSDTIIFFID